MSEGLIRADLEAHAELVPLLDVDRNGCVVCFGWASPVYDLPVEEILQNREQVD